MTQAMTGKSDERRSIARRILRGFGANVYGQGVVVFVQLAGVPILLHFWGVELYGEWLILFAIPAYLSMTDLGFPQSAANDMTAREGNGDRIGALAVFQSLRVLVAGIAILGITLVSILFHFLPIPEWFSLSQISSDQAKWIIFFLSIEVLVKLLDGVNHAGFRSQGEYAFHLSMHVSILLVQNLSIWIIAGLGFGVVAASFAYLAIRIVSIIIVTYILICRHPNFNFGAKLASSARLKALLKPALANTSFPLATALNIQGMTIVVGIMLGPTALVTFTTLRTLTRLVASTILSVTQSFEPEFARAWGGGDKDLLQTLYKRALGYAFWLVVVSSMLLIFYGSEIHYTWTRRQAQFNSELFILLLLSSCASVGWMISLSLLKAANCHFRATLWYAFISTFAVFMAGIFLRVSGAAWTAGISLLLMDLVMIAYLNSIIKNQFQLRPLKIFIIAADPRSLFLQRTSFTKLF